LQTTFEKDPFWQFPVPGKAGRPSRLWWVLVGLIFLVGLGVRLYDLDDPPLDFHPTRQMHSALIARGMYFEQRSDIPAWQREMAVAQWRMEGEIEPQLFEQVTAWAYGLAGAADLRIPRVISIFFWLVGGVFLTWLAIDLVGWGGALAAAWFFLLWPYGVLASRAFQPEPALVSLMVLAIWSGVRWQRRVGWGWAVATGLLAGAAIYIKVVAAFFIGPALLVLTLSRGGLRRFRDPQVWLVAVLALLPYGFYHIYGVYIRGSLISQFSLRFFPQMWVDPAFYLRWISNLGRVLPFELLVAAALGCFLIRRPEHRALLLAQWVGYFIYGMVLPHHISTHDYYHLLLFPTLALGFSGVADVVFRNLQKPGWLARMAAVGALLAVMVTNGYNARSQLKRFDAGKQARALSEIGTLLGRGASVTALVSDYGCGLKYWGWINPSIWLTEDEILWRASLGQVDDFSARFQELVTGKDFFVITQFSELDQQPELKSLLFERYSILKQTPDYLIFDLRAANQK
jgi:4-amino-4-deoxy-L-arabinose transferase-like glycosyltransferase